MSQLTIERCVEDNLFELLESGYKVLEKDELKKFKSQLTIINDGKFKHTPKLSVFSFKAFLNVSMLLQKSERAREVRRWILGIVATVITEMAGGNTDYINQRDEKFLLASYYGENYNKKLKNVLKKHVTDNKDTTKYANYGDKTFQAIFKETAYEYKRILDLKKAEKTRDTMYAEVLLAISSFENAVATEIKLRSEKKGSTLTREETDIIFEELAKSPFLEPQIEIARRNMASFDAGLRQKRHAKLTNYTYPLDRVDYERFLGEKSKALSERIDDNLDTLKRLKDK